MEVTAKLSYCDYEFTVDMERMKNITYNTSVNQPAPPVRMLVLNMLTTLNEKKENEVSFSANVIWTVVISLCSRSA